MISEKGKKRFKKYFKGNGTILPALDRGTDHNGYMPTYSRVTIGYMLEYVLKNEESEEDLIEYLILKIKQKKMHTIICGTIDRLVFGNLEADGNIKFKEYAKFNHMFKPTHDSYLVSPGKYGTKIVYNMMGQGNYRPIVKIPEKDIVTLEYMFSEISE